MNIAYLAACSSIHTIRWVKAMTKRGHRVHVFTLHPGSEDIDGGSVVDVLPFKAPAGYFLNAMELRRHLRKIRPDLLHVHNGSGYGTLGSLSGFQPRILSVWGSDVYEYPDLSPLHRWIVKQNLRRADRVCSTSAVMAERTRSICPTVKNLRVTPFGIDLKRFKPCKKAKQEGTITLGTVKTLEYTYGIDILIRAFADASKSLKGSDPALSQRLRLLIVGGGADFDKLKKLAERLGIGHKATFTGQVPHRLIPECLNQLDIYVAASRRESFGVAVLEASACEKPVVVSDVGGLPEIVVNGKTGMIIPSENIEGFTEAIIQLIQNKQLRKVMGISGRRHVVQHYSWRKSIEIMENIYHQTLTQN